MTHENLLVTSAAVSDKGLSDKRPQNEDSYLELRDSGLYAVADGVGGAQAGDVASQMAMEILGEAFINLAEDGDAEDRMKVAIQQANGAIYQMSNELSQLSTMATTVVAIHVSGNNATIGHVGDSRLYRLDSKGTLYRETQDHSVVEEEVRAGRMTPEQAKTHPSRNVISRALGAEQTVEIDMKTIVFEPGTKFLVCSDGVTRHIPDDELRFIMTEEDDTFVICQTIKSLCFDRGAEDNLTAVVVFVEEAAVEDMLGISEPERFEEETVVTARTPTINSGLIASSLPQTQELSPQDISVQSQNAASSEFGLDEMIEEEEIIIPTRENVEKKNSTVIPTGENRLSVGRKPEAERDVKAYRVDESGSMGGIVGKLLSGLLWLLIGAVIGFLVYHLWMKADATEVAAPRPVNTTDSQITAFEERRRDVDRNPQQYIADNVNPVDAFDHYLLGRANILVGNFDSAKKELSKAQEKLARSGDVNEKVLENDISIALGKVNSGDNKKETENNSNGNNGSVSTRQEPARGKSIDDSQSTGDN